MHVGRASGTQIYAGVGISRSVYERMGAWAAYTDHPDAKRSVVRYEREDCAVLAGVCDLELARIGVGPRCCGVAAPAAPGSRAAGSGAGAGRAARR